MTAEEILSLPSGRVLMREGNKKLRVVKPYRYNTCEICHEGGFQKMCKWEAGAGLTLLSLCPSCAVEEFGNTKG